MYLRSDYYIMYCDFENHSADKHVGSQQGFFQSNTCQNMKILKDGEIKNNTNMQFSRIVISKFKSRFDKTIEA